MIMDDEDYDYERHEKMCWMVLFGLYEHAAFVMGKSTMIFEDKIAYVSMSWLSCSGEIHGSSARRW